DNGSSEAPSHPMVKMWLARMANVLELKSLTQKSFAEYHSKRNPVERVHAVENRALSNEVFTSTGVHKEYEKDDQQHLENMEFVANERGIGDEDNFVFDGEKQLLTFLGRSERLKNEDNEHYFPKQNKLWQDVALIWDLNVDFHSLVDKSYKNDKEREYWRHQDLYKTKDKALLIRQCKEFKISSEGKKHQIVQRLVETLKLPLPPPLEIYDGDINSLPSSITELSQMPIFKLREILRYHNVLDCDTKDELAIRVGMVISGTASLAFKREVFAIKNLVTATRSLIQRQKRMYILDPKIISKQRMFTTPSSPTISTSRPRDSASVFSKKTKAFIPLPPDL
ncbi:Hypothetical predicted protein, partial [Paramuricea clavata]